jgi:folate-dependent tRNA-U54 methylase TrmFO/GidA
MAKDAVALIKADHRKVEQLFREFEEETYYPAVEAKARKDGKELVAEAVEEHHVVKVLLGELSSMSSEDESFDAKVTVLIENVRHHVEEEEEELLPQSEEVLDKEELARLGEEMAARKQQLGAG